MVFSHGVSLFTRVALRLEPLGCYQHLGGSLHFGRAAGGLQEVTVRAAALETSQFVLLVIGHCLDLCPLSRTLLLTTSWGFEDRDGVLRLPSLWKDAATAMTTCCGKNGTYAEIDIRVLPAEVRH